MILLDTNHLLGKQPGAPLLRMLKKAAEDTGHEVVLPEMVLEEYLAHYRHEVEEAAQVSPATLSGHGWGVRRQAVRA